MNAIDMLSSDHDRIREIFDQLQATERLREKRRLFREVKQLLDLHAQLEETVFYPIFQDREDFREIIQEAFDEHEEIRELVEEIEASLEPHAGEDPLMVELSDVSGSHAEWDTALDELLTCVDSHFDEEETELFPKAEESLSTNDLEKLGARLEEARRTAAETAA